MAVPPAPVSDAALAASDEQAIATAASKHVFVFIETPFSTRNHLRRREAIRPYCYGCVTISPYITDNDFEPVFQNPH